MPSANNYVKLLTLCRILTWETTPKEPMSTSKLLKRMDDYGTPIERKQLYHLIRVLNQGGIKIGYYQKPPIGYYYEDGWV